MRIKQLAREGKLSYRYKMFKAGKFMMTSALASVALWGGLALTNQTASAATTQADNAVTATVTDTSATASTVSDDNTSQVTTGDATTTNDTSATVTDATAQTTDDSAVVNDANNNENTTTQDNTTSVAAMPSDTNAQTATTAETTAKTDDTQVSSTDATTTVKPSIAKDDTVATNDVQSDDATVATSKSEDTQTVDSATTATADTTAKVATDSVTTPTTVNNDQATTIRVTGDLAADQLTALKAKLADIYTTTGQAVKLEMVAADATTTKPTVGNILGISAVVPLTATDFYGFGSMSQLTNYINFVPNDNFRTIAITMRKQDDAGSDYSYSLMTVTTSAISDGNGGLTGSNFVIYDFLNDIGLTKDAYTYEEINAPLSYSSSASTVPVATISLIKKVPSETVTRTIHYQLADGSRLASTLTMPADVIENLNYTVNTESTGDVWYNPVFPNDVYTDQVLANLDGYTATITTTGNPTLTTDDTTGITTVKAGAIAMMTEDLPANQTITVTFTANSATGDVTVPTTVAGESQPKTFTDVSGKTGDLITLTMPTIQGYTPDKTTVTAEVNPDGTITTNDSVAYSPNEVTATVTVPATVAGKDAPQAIDDVTGKTGDTLTLDVPTIEGYTADKKTVTAVVNPDGTITTEDQVAYTPNEVTSDVTIPATVAGENAPQTVTGVTGRTGDNLTLDAPTVEGYTPDKATVTATVNPDGTITTNDNLVYSPNEVTTDVTVPATVAGESAPQTIKDATGKTGDTLTLDVPAVEGYTPDKSTITATVNPDGTITTKDNVVYTPNEVTTDVTIPATVGGQNDPQTVTGVTGKTGDTLTITVPTVEGYTPNKTTVTVTVNPDGTITTKDNVVYTGNDVTANVTIPATVDGSDAPQTVEDVTGKVGDKLTLDVPELPGYTADKSTVTAMVNPDGTITTEDSVVYTAIPTTPTDNGSTGTTPSDNGNVGSTTETTPTTGTDSEATNPVVPGSTSETVIPNTNEPETQTVPTSKTPAETQVVANQTATGRQSVTNTVAATQMPATITAETPGSSTTATANNEAAKLPQTDETAKTPASLLGLVLLGLAGLGFGKFKRHE